MQHYIFAMRAGDPAPAGHGDIKTWFEYYKMDTGPDVFVPFPPGSLGEDEHPGPGDKLWFAMDGFLIGVTDVTGFNAGGFYTDKLEVYYDSDKILKLITGGPAVDISLANGPAMGKVTEPRIAAWYDDYLQSLAVDR